MIEVRLSRVCSFPMGRHPEQKGRIAEALRSCLVPQKPGRRKKSAGLSRRGVERCHEEIQRGSALWRSCVES